MFQAIALKYILDRYLDNFKSDFEDEELNFDFCVRLVKSLG